MNLTPKNDALINLLFMLEKYDIKIFENGRVVFNQTESWSEYRDKLKTLTDKFRNEFFDNLPIIQDWDKVEIYRNSIVNQFLKTKNKLQVLYNIFVGVEGNVIGKEYQGLRLKFVKELLDDDEILFKIEVPENLHFLSKYLIQQIAFFIAVAKKTTEELYHIIRELSASKDSSKGFKSFLTDKQIETLFTQLLNNKYIHRETDPVHFKAIFKNEPLPYGFEPVKWIFQTNRKQPHKSALRVLLTHAIGKSPDQKTINICFTDSKGEKIQLAKPKKDQYEHYWSKKFNKMIIQ